MTSTTTKTARPARRATRPPRLPALRRFLAAQENLVLGLILMILAVVVIQVPGYWHVETLFTVLRASMVDMVFALGVLLVLVAGGIDVSFLAVGAFSAYVACKIALDGSETSPAWTIFLIAVAIGAVMGVINALVVIAMQVSTLIATLATSAVYLGVLFAVVGANVITVVPESLREVAKTQLWEAPGAVRGVTRLNILILLVALCCVAVAFFLHGTVAGRSVFAIGGDAESAARAGIRVDALRILVFALAGALAGTAGIIQVTLAGRADPTTFMGRELDVIAAVVIGGAAVTGGRGTVRGVCLGVVLVSLISTSLVPLGVPSIWQKAVVGVLLLVGVLLQSLSSRVRTERPILDGDAPPPRVRGTDQEGARSPSGEALSAGAGRGVSADV
ncbi:monosaccharide ABC transporter membrane protein, CUT2 family [Austwickia chelonae]|uniref:Putative ABC transporter permease protein n=1 Tax=Austwickia chelonae NBRC 105200 TaxID=1184607 RepID=K6VJC3_9MICO|nr:ABC transporter permease [Austwickia chelonae]GAB76849.1 putative ABC transporter permease protein [Austwickia chelonae NBRC 105200]SEW31532.1 monosaccharide ABC transporter membrane protein, CUT2 family [Austwickia chelonae]